MKAAKKRKISKADRLVARILREVGNALADSRHWNSGKDLFHVYSDFGCRLRNRAEELDPTPDEDDQVESP